ncbi:unnamed protein product [Paramecium sonneborni]|uniref:Uncharacterized protein n=1 Tax=Paramecium sonneborni TaxID=65129 RepID=A0A8S1RTI2_9CILI|nr:unnamed protein product [Paramecium sonneborni]
MRIINNLKIPHIQYILWHNKIQIQSNPKPDDIKYKRNKSNPVAFLIKQMYPNKHLIQLQQKLLNLVQNQPYLNQNRMKIEIQKIQQYGKEKTIKVNKLLLNLFSINKISPETIPQIVITRLYTKKITDNIVMCLRQFRGHIL